MADFRNLDEQQLFEILLKAKQNGFSDVQLAWLWHTDEQEIRQLRQRVGVKCSFKLVDTCAAEFQAYTPYYYSCYETPFLRQGQDGTWRVETESEVRRTDRPSVVILGGGPNRIGQGIEFDYCCCHAAFALKEAGYDAIMVNSNPETVSTDYDTATRLYFEPLTLEHVLDIIEVEQPIGVIVQFGGQTPLKLALPLQAAGVPILGTSPDSIDLTEDRKRFNALLEELGIPQPPGGTANTFEEAVAIAREIGYPVLVRPSYVLGGRAMEIVYREDRLETYTAAAFHAADNRAVLVDKFLDNAIEVDVDAICDGHRVYVGGIMEHIEYAGVHSGDSACILPPRTLQAEVIEQIIEYTTRLALHLNVRGLMNVQYAVHGTQGQSTRSLAEGSVCLKHNRVYVLEVNPRASRTVPFVSKATGIPMARIAALVMAGKTLDELGVPQRMPCHNVAVKEAVFPFVKFPGVDAVLGPEMRSTGEVMGIAPEFGAAFAKSQAAAGMPLPGWQVQITGNAPQTEKAVLLSVSDPDKPGLLPVAQGLQELGFRMLATPGTQAFLAENSIEAQVVRKIQQGRPDVEDAMLNGDIGLVINTPEGELATVQERQIRRRAVERGIPYVTTLAGARAALEAFRAMRGTLPPACPLQDYHRAG
jgi:carbamoyl-phosphate synthase large subunit